VADLDVEALRKLRFHYPGPTGATIHR